MEVHRTKLGLEKFDFLAVNYCIVVLVLIYKIIFCLLL